MFADFVGARLGIQPVGLGEALDAHAAHGVAIGVVIGDVRPVAVIGFEEDDVGFNLDGGAHGLGERVGGFHRDVDAALVVLRVGIEDYRDLGQTVDGPAVGLFEASGQFHGDDLRTFFEQGMAQGGGKLQPSRHHGKVSEATAAQAAGVRSERHSAWLLRRAPGAATSAGHLRATRRAGLGLLELHREAGDVDAVADRVALVGGVGLLQEIGDVVEDLLFAEGQVLFEDGVLFVALGGNPPGSAAGGGSGCTREGRTWKRRRSWWPPAGTGGGPGS